MKSLILLLSGCSPVQQASNRTGKGAGLPDTMIQGKTNIPRLHGKGCSFSSPKLGIFIYIYKILGTQKSKDWQRTSQTTAALTLICWQVSFPS